MCLGHLRGRILVHVAGLVADCTPEHGFVWWLSQVVAVGVMDTVAVSLLLPSTERVRGDCYRRCLGLTLCNSVVYNVASQRCMPMVIQAATRAVEVPGEGPGSDAEKQTVALRVCKPGEAPGAQLLC